MKFVMYHPVHFEQWDWRNEDTGIGGSETHQIEMAWRLAKRGHEVISYAPIPVDCERQWRGTQWRHLDEVDFTEDGTWIIYRSPETADHFKPGDDQELWLICQDEDYPSFSEKRAEKFTRICPLCNAQAQNIVKTKPYLNDKIWITSNGVRVDLIRDILASEVPVRDPHRIMYASSPDRGLKYVLETLKRAREYVPELELHAFYGFNNIDKLIKLNPQFAHYKKLKAEIQELMKQDNVYWHGRVSQRELLIEWLKTGIWLYQTNFRETSCITCLEAQSLGAIPITNPWWALGENVMSGIFIQGDAWGDRLVKARYVGELVRLASDLELQETIRTGMMREAMVRFNWERIVDQWEASIYTPSWPHLKVQWMFQRKHAKGLVLNVGCGPDMAGFKSVGGVNVDVCEVDPGLRIKNKVDVIADVRFLPTSLYGKYDTVVLGDVLEHMSYDDGVLSLDNCRKCIKNGGQVIVTCPDDRRGLTEDVHTGNPVVAYTEGVTTFHRALPKSELEQMLKEAHLTPEYWEPIDYTYFEGWGVLCS